MSTEVFVDNAKVTSKGQITIPKDVRKVLGVDSGDRISFIVNNGEVKVVNAAVYAMRMLQDSLRGEACRADIKNEQDVVEMVKSVRNED
ncbi:AbrB/MazE/SpoVT family DNA-binding domain-containing protein [Pseudoramibacter porci]|uniref:AbrB/MazE/SpoVT family DNA-binding domain-containing protein n=1 Tax=Pseudoramibacter porci TaxID=2606631 RepID=A0A7X2NHA7_9FIRM|nr:AbrB/MazE/SpoVT family DNA-binding domain-containing protein [Pseudoramibacter porci]MSS20390.1 AbrB/MazE/SpoVT family DNA-binding domain-containing protein [Pseudoramibacter porci]